MPPKRLRTKKAAEPTPSQNFNSISIQTDDDHNKEVANYQKQIQLLQKEIAELKKQVITLQSENNILRNVNTNVINSDVIKMNLIQKTAVKVRNEVISSPGSGTKVKGCSCKGNCSNKICGCVKKGIPCQEFCRCNDAQCKNQEPDKENIEQGVLTKEGQNALEKLGRLTLNQESIYASEKKLKRSMFSPFGDRTGISNGQTYPASPLAFETRRKLFTQDSDDIVDIGSNPDEENIPSEPKHLDCDENFTNLKKSKNQFPSTPIAKRTRKLKITEGNLKSVINVNQTEKHLKVTEAKEIKEKQNVQQAGQKLPQETNKKNMEQLQVPMILLPNENKESGEDDVFLPEISKNVKKVVHSPVALRKKSKSKSASPDAYNIVRRKYSDRTTANAKSKSVSPDEYVNYRKNNKKDKSKLGKVQHSPQPSTSKVTSVTSDDQNISNNVKTENNQSSQINDPVKFLSLPQSSFNQNSLSFESNVSESSSNSNHDVLDISLNPMIPKHQLPRSPIQAAGSIILRAENKRFSPPKKELAVAEVDWNQHQSELVSCKKCNRRFFPHRVDKHARSCKGI